MLVFSITSIMATLIGLIYTGFPLSVLWNRDILSHPQVTPNVVFQEINTEE